MGEFCCVVYFVFYFGGCVDCVGCVGSVVGVWY